MARFVREELLTNITHSAPFFAGCARGRRITFGCVVLLYARLAAKPHEPSESCAVAALQFETRTRTPHPRSVTTVRRDWSHMRSKCELCCADDPICQLHLIGANLCVGIACTCGSRLDPCSKLSLARSATLIRFDECTSD